MIKQSTIVRYNEFSTYLYGFSAAFIADTLALEPSAKESVNLNKSFHLAATRCARLSRRESIMGKSSLKGKKGEGLILHNMCC